MACLSAARHSVLCADIISNFEVWAMLDPAARAGPSHLGGSAPVIPGKGRYSRFGRRYPCRLAGPRAF